jgi:hypothetical protein
MTFPLCDTNLPHQGEVHNREFDQANKTPDRNSRQFAGLSPQQSLPIQNPGLSGEILRRVFSLAYVAGSSVDEENFVSRIEKKNTLSEAPGFCPNVEKA